VRADGAEHEGIAVWRSIGDPLRSGHSSGAAHILDDHLLTEDLAHALRHYPAENISWTAGSEWNDHSEGLGRIALCQGCPHQRE
jgi:hypothetical protein